jgi:DNA modification methylase
MTEKTHLNTGDLNDLTGKEWIKATKSWFICDSRRYYRNRHTELHPARFPEEMVREFLLFFTKHEGWVLDPFCGSGSALVSCLENGRRAVGVELSERYAHVAAQRVAELDECGAARVLQADSRRLTDPLLWAESAGPERDARGLPQFDFIITSPPYCNILRTSRGGVVSAQKRRAKKGLDTHYSEDPADLGNTGDYEGFIEALGAVFDGCAQLLKPGKYLVCVVQNFRASDGEVKPLAWDLARRISRTLAFQGERIWCQDSKPLGIWGFPKVFVPNYHHHYCLIFRKRPEG